MDKIIIQESLAPLLAFLNQGGNNNGNNGGNNNGGNNNNNSNSMQSILTNNLATTGQYIHNPGTGNSTDDVIIKPQDIDQVGRPTGKNFFGKPTYQVSVESPLNWTNRKEFLKIGSLAQEIENIIEAKALVSIFNSYGFLLSRVDANTVRMTVIIMSGSYLRDNVQLFGVNPQANFTLIRVSDSSSTTVTIPISNSGQGFVNLNIANVQNNDDFELWNFELTDNSGYTDTKSNQLPLEVGQSFFGVEGEVAHKKAVMNIDLHYASKAYPDEYIQLFYASDYQDFFQNKLNGSGDGSHRVEFLTLEYTKI